MPVRLTHSKHPLVRVVQGLGRDGFVEERSGGEGVRRMELADIARRGADEGTGLDGLGVRP